MLTINTIAAAAALAVFAFSPLDPRKMNADEEAAMWAAMGLPMGFGKKPKAESAARIEKAFEETRRADSRVPPSGSSASLPRQTNTAEPLTAGTGKTSLQDKRREVIPAKKDQGDSDEDDSDSDLSPEGDILPISHQASLRDHMKVKLHPCLRNSCVAWLNFKTRRCLLSVSIVLGRVL